MFRMAGTAWSLLPPVLAIGLAISTRRVYASLFAGVAAGTLLAARLDPTAALHRLVTRDLLLAFYDAARGGWMTDRLVLLAFTFLIGSAVQLMQDSGGTEGLVSRIVRYASTRPRAQLLAWSAGMLIFFDDYASILIVGPASLAVFARYRLSRAKLAWIVDTTAASVASIWFISTWIGYEVGLIADALRGLPDPALAALSPYGVFLDSIPQRFYLLFSVALVPLAIWIGRDLEPMAAAERAARRAPAARGAGGRRRPGPWGLAAAPIAVLLLGTLAGIGLTGRAALAADGRLAGASLRDLVGAADSYRAMLWAAAAAAALAAGLALATRRLRLRAVAISAARGAWTMAPPLLILVLAWALGDLCRELGTGTWVGSTFAASAKPWALPTLVFLCGAAISFATGTSFGTMAVLMPVAIPLAASSAAAAGLDTPAAAGLLVSTCGSVLAGAVFGDHCSIVSDTTILSATATRCSLVEHFRTQIPYAGLAGAAAILCGTLPAGLRLSPWACLAAGLAAMAAALRLLGRPVR
jgi:Na+/H+ antiporter NhaC